MYQAIASVNLRWLAADEGGRQSGPPPGALYATTARFADDQITDQFSVVLRFSEPRPATHPAELRMLAPDNLPGVAKRLAAGVRLLIHEGTRVVAEGVVTSVCWEDRNEPTFA